jgi:hypothetical protein
MPIPISPASRAASVTLQLGVATYLQHYATKVLGYEAAIVAPNAGYRAYDKRVAFAERCISGAEKYAMAASLMFCKCDPDLEQNAQGNGVSVFQLLTGSSQGFELAQADPTQLFSWTDMTQTSGKSIWDALAGVNQSDLI